MQLCQLQAGENFVSVYIVSIQCQSSTVLFADTELLLTIAVLDWFYIRCIVDEH